MFRHAWKNEKMAENLNHDYIWEIGFGKLSLFTLYTYVSHIYELLKSFLTTNVYCSVMRERGEREREREREERERGREAEGARGRGTNDHCLMHFAIIVGADSLAAWKVRPLGQEFRGCGLSPLSLSPQEGEALQHRMFL